MELKMFCQSCTMPIDSPENRGTEEDGSASSEYCRYCYQNGAFTSPAMNIDSMRSIVIEQMGRQHLPQDLIQKSVDMLPHLKRWRNEKQLAPKAN
jgi:hypothetical protein